MWPSSISHPPAASECRVVEPVCAGSSSFLVSSSTRLRTLCLRFRLLCVRRLVLEVCQRGGTLGLLRIGFVGDVVLVGGLCVAE